jgi:hypothetical protein
MKTLLRTFIFFATGCLLLASTCKKDTLSNPENVQLNTSFEVPLNGNIFIDSESIELSVNEITDVRCPVDVQCFWAGNAKVELSMEAGNTGKQLSLCIGQCDTRYQKTDTVGVEHQDKSYNLILTEVKPYPGTGSGKKSAVFILQSR